MEERSRELDLELGYKVKTSLKYFVFDMKMKTFVGMMAKGLIFLLRSASGCSVKMKTVASLPMRSSKGKYWMSDDSK